MLKVCCNSKIPAAVCDQDQGFILTLLLFLPLCRLKESVREQWSNGLKVQIVKKKEHMPKKDMIIQAFPWFPYTNTVCAMIQVANNVLLSLFNIPESRLQWIAAAMQSGNWMLCSSVSVLLYGLSRDTSNNSLYGFNICVVWKPGLYLISSHSYQHLNPSRGETRDW